MKPGVSAVTPPGRIDAAAKAEPIRGPSKAAGDGGQGRSGVGGSQPAKPDPSVPGVTPPIPAEPKLDAGQSPTPSVAGTPASPSRESAKPAPGAGEAARLFPAAAGKPDAPSASPSKSNPPGPKTDAAKSDPAKAPGPQKPGLGGGAASAALTDGPIIDMTARRVAEPAPEPKGVPTRAANAASTGPAAGTRSGEGADAQAPSGSGGSGAAPRVSAAARTEAPARGPGFGSVAAAGLLGGVVGAGLLFAVERAGMLGPVGDDTRINALDQRIAGQFSALDQRVAALAPRDALGALDKRIAANEAALKPLPDAVRGAEAAAKQALDRANAGGTAPAAPAEGPAAGLVPAPSVPADLVARLDSLDQRLAALQEEPGREQPADARLGVVPAGDGRASAALDERVKALEGKVLEGQGSGGTADLAPKIAALQGDVEARTKANAEADQALGQRLDALQKSVDDRVKVATEAVQTATQASRDAAEAGRTQAQEATKTLDRRLQDQGERIVALDKALALRAEASTVQAALRVVAADRVAGALDAGAPYAEPLATLRRLETGDASRIDALAPFAETGAPTADRLGAQFRPIAEKLAASRKAAEAREVAATGDIKSRFLSMADAIVQVRRVDAPAPAGSAEADPAARVQAALDGGALVDAARAFETLPQDAKAQAGGFGATLRARAAAAQAAQALLSDAFKGLPTGTANAPEPGR